MNKSVAGLALLVMTLPAATAFAQAPASCDLPRGKDVFLMCSACHALTAQESRHEGPTLAGVIGRKAGSLPGFAYSADLRAAAWEWTPGLLDTFLAAPRKAVRGTTMMFPGLKDPADRAAVVCYVAEASAPRKP
jgi:cytochrome c